jgi:hypothetical protein
VTQPRPLRDPTQAATETAFRWRMMAYQGGSCPHLRLARRYAAMCRDQCERGRFCFSVTTKAKPGCQADLILGEFELALAPAPTGIWQRRDQPSCVLL